MILGLDLASLNTGYAVISLTRPIRLIDCGMLRVRGEDQIERIDAMICEIDDLIQDLSSDLAPPPRLRVVALEMTSGKVSQRHRGGGSGLAVYGMAVGSVRTHLRDQICYFPDQHQYELLPVRENVWTKGRPKHKRMEALAAEFPPYRQALKAGKDKKGDIADAIGVALYAQAELIRRKAIR